MSKKDQKEIESNGPNDVPYSSEEEDYPPLEDLSKSEQISKLQKMLSSEQNSKSRQKTHYKNQISTLKSKYETDLEEARNCQSDAERALQNEEFTVRLLQQEIRILEDDLSKQKIEWQDTIDRMKSLHKDDMGQKKDEKKELSKTITALNKDLESSAKTLRNTQRMLSENRASVGRLLTENTELKADVKHLQSRLKKLVEQIDEQTVAKLARDVQVEQLKAQQAEAKVKLAETNAKNKLKKNKEEFAVRANLICLQSNLRTKEKEKEELRKEKKKKTSVKAQKTKMETLQETMLRSNKAADNGLFPNPGSTSVQENIELLCAKKARGQLKQTTMTQFDFAKASIPPLPDGWKPFIDIDEGTTCFRHKTSGEILENVVQVYVRAAQMEKEKTNGITVGSTIGQAEPGPTKGVPTAASAGGQIDLGPAEAVQCTTQGTEENPGPTEGVPEAAAGHNVEDGEEEVCTISYRDALAAQEAMEAKRQRQTSARKEPTSAAKKPRKKSPKIISPEEKNGGFNHDGWFTQPSWGLSETAGGTEGGSEGNLDSHCWYTKQRALLEEMKSTSDASDTASEGSDTMNEGGGSGSFDHILDRML